MSQVNDKQQLLEDLKRMMDDLRAKVNAGRVFSEDVPRAFRVNFNAQAFASALRENGRKR